MAARRRGEQLNLHGIEAVGRALQVLKYLQGTPKGATPTMIAAGTHLNRTTVMRILVTLSEHGFVTWDPPSGCYSLGPAALELSASYLSTTDLPSMALPEMVRLRDATGETVSLYIRDDIYRICVQRVESLQALRQVIHLGERLPLHLGASGKVLLAALEEERREALLDRCPLAAPEARHRLRREIQETTARGYAISIGEREPGVSAVAAPVCQRSGATVAALSVSGPLHRMGGEQLDRLVPVVIDAARRISSLLLPETSMNSGR